jgi:hypothetical protein
MSMTIGAVAAYTIMVATFFIVLGVIGLFGAVVYLFVIEPRSKIHDL